MKRHLLLAATMLFCFVASAQTITKISADGSGNPFTLPKGSHVYGLFKMPNTCKALGVDDAHFTYIGEDAAEGRNLWNWQSTAKTPGGPQSPAGENNSFGQPAEFYKMAGATGWSGWGLNVGKNNPIDLSGITSDFSFHFAVKQISRKGSAPVVCLYDGEGNEAKFEIGTGRGQLNIPADGNWYSVDISCADLLDIYGVDFSTAANKTYKDLNLFTFTWGASPDGLYIDKAAFFYGPGEATGIKNVQKNSKASNGNVYNLSGQRINKINHGIFIQNGRKFIAK